MNLKMQYVTLFMTAYHLAAGATQDETLHTITVRLHHNYYCFTLKKTNNLDIERMQSYFGTDSWREELDSLPKIDELRKRLREFWKLDLSELDHNSVRREFVKRVNLFPGFCQQFPATKINGLRVFRARKNIDFKVENGILTETFGSPPANTCKYNGRANIKNTSVFYGAMDPITAYWEIQPKVNDIISLSVWRFRMDRDFNIISVLNRDVAKDGMLMEFANETHHHKEEFNQEIGYEKSEELNLLSNTVSEWFLKEEFPYSRSSWYANEALYKVPGMDCIWYPSQKTELTSACLAFNSNYARLNLELDKIYNFKIIRGEQGVNEFDFHRVGEYDSNRIIWRDANENDIEEFELVKIDEA